MLRDEWVRLESAFVSVRRPKKAHCSNLILEALVLSDNCVQIIRMVYLANCPWVIRQKPEVRCQDLLTSRLLYQGCCFRPTFDSTDFQDMSQVNSWSTM